MMKIVILAVLVCIVNANNYQTINTNSLKRVFESSLKPNLANDLGSVYYAVKGLQLLGENTAAYNTELCNFVKSKLDQNNLESVYFASNLASTIGNCQLGLQNLNQLLTTASQSQNVADLYYYTLLAKSNNVQVDSAKLSRSVLDALKKDNSIVNQAYALHIATHLTGETDKAFVDNIDDLLEQADEYDQVYLQYEGGAATTSFVLDGILKLSEKHKKLTAKLDGERLRKFVNYLTSKRHVSNSKSALSLLEVALRLANNQFAIPVVVNRVTGVSVTKQSPSVLVSVTNILGRAVKHVDFTVDAGSLVTEQNKQQLFSGRKSLTQKSSDNSAFELSLYEASVQPGFYTVQVSVQAKNNDKRLLVLNNQFNVKFLQQVEIVDLNVASADREQSSPKLSKVTPGQKLAGKLEVDHTSKFHVRFGLKDTTSGSLVAANQAFVRFADLTTNTEIMFIAEQNAQTKQYACEVDFSTHAKSFNNRNGVYLVQLIVSDSLIQNSRVVDLVDVNLRVTDKPVTSTKAQLYASKPEIQHIFRQPEQTPSKLVSSVFTVLTVLPSVVLVILWFSLGFNLSKFQFSLSALVFHVALAGIFGLFYAYWVYLNMFVTLRYLSVLAVVAVVSGKRLLSNLASGSAQKEKTN